MILVVSSELSNVTWTPPCGWTGPDAVLYQSFDSSEGFILMEGNQTTIRSIPLIAGKVGCRRII